MRSSTGAKQSGTRTQSRVFTVLSVLSLNADMRFIGAVEDASLRILRRANVGRAGEGLIAIQIDSRAKIAEGDMKVVDTAELHAVGVFDVQHNMVFGRFDDQRPAGNP
ncbi:Uncharacterised protein [Bifidobacterium bifidum]|nr:Uncharacterised protein [Bifidobacterium bifidum]